MSDWDGEVLEIEREEPAVLLPAAVKRLLAHNDVLRELQNLKQVAEIKFTINELLDPEMAQVLWSEFSQAEQEALWIAPSKGGVFTTHERKVLKGEV